MKRIFSGIQPTGEIHIGNYLGAIQNWVSLINDYDCIYCIVDYHAITIDFESNLMESRILETAIINMGCGLDPDRCALFVQSHVPEHTELTWIFNCITPIGELERMTQFKDKSKQHRHNINVGLLDYPVLQAADAVVANLECAITALTEPWDETPKVFHFRARPEAVAVLQAANVQCVSLANNHTLDFRRAGLLETLSHLEGAGIPYAGAGLDLDAARAVAVIDVGDLRLGMAAFTDNEPPFAAAASPTAPRPADPSNPQNPSDSTSTAAPTNAALPYQTHLIPSYLLLRIIPAKPNRADPPTPAPLRPIHSPQP